MNPFLKININKINESHSKRIFPNKTYRLKQRNTFLISSFIFFKYLSIKELWE